MTIASICIPSFNRTKQLQRLLDSVDCAPSLIEIVVSEDFSANRSKIRELVTRFSDTSPYKVVYHENTKNLGFDGNLRKLCNLATGKFIIFMGDDDFFVEKKLDKFLSFLQKNSEFNYVLRSYVTSHQDGTVEHFSYLPQIETFPSGEQTVSWMFKRSVNLSGFTISNIAANSYPTSNLDGTLLYQVYLMGRACMESPSIYCDIAFSHAFQSFRDNPPNFGHSEAEKGRYTPGEVTIENSLNFIGSYFQVTRYLDNEYSTNLTELVHTSLDRNSYPLLSIQRKNGVLKFLRYSSILQRKLSFGNSIFFHIFKWSLAILGERNCDRVIIFIKKRLGYTPNL